MFNSLLHNIIFEYRILAANASGGMSPYVNDTSLQLALIIVCYLGVAGESGSDVKVLVGGVAALCGGVRKDVLKYLGENSSVLKDAAL